MCGRFSNPYDLSHLTGRFGFAAEGLTWRPRHNLAPGELALAVTAGAHGRQGRLLRWGLIPAWADDPRIAWKLINARSETAATKPAFRQALARRRCLLPAGGFLEWDRAAKPRQPWYFRRPDGQPLALAGLWETWRAPDGQDQATFTILTTSANQRVGRLHDRMPVILAPEAEAAWLDPSTRLAALAALMAPAPEALLTAWPVSTRVNRAGPDDPELLRPLEAGLFGGADTLSV